MHARRRMPGRNCEIGLVFIASVDLPLLLLPFFHRRHRWLSFLVKDKRDLGSQPPQLLNVRAVAGAGRAIEHECVGVQPPKRRDVLAPSLPRHPFRPISFRVAKIWQPDLSEGCARALEYFNSPEIPWPAVLGGFFVLARREPSRIGRPRDRNDARCRKRIELQNLLARGEGDQLRLVVGQPHGEFLVWRAMADRLLRLPRAGDEQDTEKRD